MSRHVLVVGYSSIVQRRVLPALHGLARVSLASRRMATLDLTQAPMKFETVWGDPMQAIAETDAHVIYVSGENSAHHGYARAALARNKHVIVDKPATESLALTTELVEQAERRDVLFAEAAVFLYHPLFRLASEIALRAPSGVRQLVANFSFPPLADGNFRHEREKGGGAALDLGAYVFGPGRFFFNAMPERVDVAVTARNSQVETAFSVLVHYPGGRTTTGHFGFDSDYRNALTALGPGLSIDLTRPFTPPPDAELEIAYTLNGQRGTVKAPRADSFREFLLAVFEDLDTGHYGRWRHALDHDARATALLTGALERAR